LLLASGEGVEIFKLKEVVDPGEAMICLDFIDLFFLRPRGLVARRLLFFLIPGTELETTKLFFFLVWLAWCVQVHSALIGLHKQLYIYYIQTCSTCTVIYNVYNIYLVRSMHWNTIFTSAGFVATRLCVRVNEIHFDV
jgi:hypothetical protein